MTVTTKNEYLLVIRGSSQNWKSLGPEEMQRVLKAYSSWVRELRDQSILKTGYGLSHNARLLHKSGDHLQVDGPYAESKEALTGMFIIEATSLEEAVRIAKTCPALTHGESVEVVEASAT